MMAIDEVAERLGTYLLPGRVVEPTRGPTDAAAAERGGLGSVWLSDRWDQKEAGAMLGAIAAATAKVRIATGITHPSTRHPLVLAGMASTLQALSGGRFILGIGRSVPMIWRTMGLRPPTTRALADLAQILRRLWAGETVSYHGPLGDFPGLKVAHRYEGSPPPLVLAAMGPRTLAMTGEAYDGVLLHPFLTTEAVVRSVAGVRAGAERAGRDPAAVRIYAVVVAAPSLPPEQEAAIVGGRAITYLQAPGFGELLVGINGWDARVLAKLRTHPLLASLGKGLADQAFTLAELGEVAKVLPEAWISEGAAVGTPKRCAERLRQYLDAGVDEIVLHGNVPSALGEMIDEFRAG
jgi:probable F420-dependent oxidoreductase